MLDAHPLYTERVLQKGFSYRLRELDPTTADHATQEKPFCGTRAEPSIGPVTDVTDAESLWPVEKVGWGRKTDVRDLRASKDFNQIPLRLSGERK